MFTMKVIVVLLTNLITVVNVRHTFHFEKRFKTGEIYHLVII